MIAEIVAKNIAALRKQRGLTQQELARYIHCSDKVISKWERGESVPDVETLAALADFYGVSLDGLARDGLVRHTKSESEKVPIDTKTNDGAKALSIPATEAPPDSPAVKAALDAAYRIRHKKLISRGARIASLVILPLLINFLYLIQTELFDADFLTPKTYFLSVVPAVLIANFVISLITHRTFDSTEVLFLLFASVWTAGIVVIFGLWSMDILVQGSERMRIWYILLAYNIFIALSVILTGMGVKRWKKKRAENRG
ncbi:MAG: helix-turn-helix transcriptional regulator [Firmicutes bacterium]|nr:helix-turn-helix transcriptional regulator [Bacillota bacterium]